MQMLCETFLKELKSVDHPRDHKVIDVWLIMLLSMPMVVLYRRVQRKN
jgi:hypothetical protein